jgi:signal transduction histidine kinase
MLTPMNAIMGMMQIAKVRGIQDNMKGIFSDSYTQAYNLLNMINDVLDITSMEYGTFKLSDSTFDIHEVFRIVRQTAEHQVSHKKQTLAFHVDSSIPALLIGDEKRLRQVISCLLANAIKFTPEHGEICFGARMLNINNNAVTLQIEVADNGIGVPKDKHDTIFDLFEQVDGSITREYGGIGIGLPLSKRVVEMMGGEIKFESESGRGSTFTLAITIKREADNGQ